MANAETAMPYVSSTEIFPLIDIEKVRINSREFGIRWRRKSYEAMRSRTEDVSIEEQYFDAPVRACAFVDYLAAFASTNRR